MYCCWWEMKHSPVHYQHLTLRCQDTAEWFLTLTAFYNYGKWSCCHDNHRVNTKIHITESSSRNERLCVFDWSVQMNQRAVFFLHSCCGSERSLTIARVWTVRLHSPFFFFKVLLVLVLTDQIVKWCLLPNLESTCNSKAEQWIKCCKLETDSCLFIHRCFQEMESPPPPSHHTRKQKSGGCPCVLL